VSKTIKVKRRLSRYEKLMIRHAALSLKRERGELTREEAAELHRVMAALQHKEKAKFGGSSPSEAQERLIQQAYRWNQSVNALTNALKILKEVLGESYDESTGTYNAETIRPAHDAINEGPRSFVNWAAAEAEQRARKEIENDVDSGVGDGDVAGDGAGTAPPMVEDAEDSQQSRDG
jgi:hypothetical protein